MNTSFRMIPLLSLATALGCYGDKVFVEDGAGGGTPTSTSTSGGGPPSGGAGTGGNGTGASGGEASGGGGEAPECTSPAECPTPASECVEPRCENMLCVEVNKAAGDPCNGVRVCDGNGACVECISNAQCTNPDTCELATHQCVPPQCSNGSQDPGETDVDCGGPSCQPCQNRDGCVIASDCVSGFCNSGFVCKPCSSDGECAAVQFCNTGTCVPKLMNGSACNGDGQCTGGNCVLTGIGGICCNTNCAGTCKSCAIGDTGVATGTCGDVLVNLDPNNDCAMGPCQTGNCNGTGSCGLLPPNSSCNDGLFCNGNDTCTATGNCNHSGNPCPGEAVPDFNCSESCNEASDNCTAPDPAGTPCTDGFFCTGNDTCNGSGTCVAGSNPCPGHNAPINCNDSCNESADLCTANDVAGTMCNQDGDGIFGVCTTNGACMGD